MVAPPVPATPTTYFLPDDWILRHEPQALTATKLGTGEVITVEGDLANAAVARDLPQATWSVLAKNEPLLGELQAKLDAHALVTLNRGSLLKGSGWRQLFVELTARCNERCVHCYAESSPERHESLTWDEVRAVLDDAKALRFGLVQLTGGDPLVSPHCVPAAEYARRIGIPKIEVYTNGLALRGEVYERLRDLDVSFAFSFYSHDAERHDAITRTPGSHDRTSRAIRRATSDGLTVRTGTILMTENEGDAASTRDYLVQLGVRATSVGVDHAHAVGRSEVHHQPSATVPSPPAPQGAHAQTASRPFGGTAAVSYDGLVYPCIFSRHLALGSIRKESLETILTAPRAIPAPADNALDGRDVLTAKLSCWECRTRSHLLRAVANA
ncbi:MAG: radical SAM protein [Polyangiales bacterium]